MICVSNSQSDVDDEEYVILMRDTGSCIICEGALASLVMNRKIM